MSTKIITNIREDNTLMNVKEVTQSEIQNQPMNPVSLEMNHQTKSVRAHQCKTNNSSNYRKENHMSSKTSLYWIKSLYSYYRSSAQYQNPIRIICPSRFIFDALEDGLNLWQDIDNLYIQTKNKMSSHSRSDGLTEWDSFCNNKKSLIDADARLKKIIGDLDIKYNARLGAMNCTIDKKCIDGKIFIRLCTSAPKHQDTSTTDVKHSFLQKVHSGLRLFIGLFFGH